MERLYRALENYSREDYYPFHMPGHKRNPGTVDTKLPFDRDITEIEGFDNLHHPEEILKESPGSIDRGIWHKRMLLQHQWKYSGAPLTVSATVPGNGPDTCCKKLS